MIRAIIFDLYGTLIQLDRDTHPYLRFARQIHPADPKEVTRRSLLITTRDITDFADRLGVTQAGDLTTFDSDLRRDIESSRVFGHASEVLAHLRELGLMLGLISNVASPYKEPFYRHHLDGHFDFALFSCDIGLRKPDPEIYRKMAESLEVELPEALMVGDSRTSDYNGARNAAMKAVHLQRHSQDPGGGVIRNLEELPAMLSYYSKSG